MCVFVCLCPKLTVRVTSNSRKSIHLFLSVSQCGGPALGNQGLHDQRPHDDRALQARDPEVQRYDDPGRALHHRPRVQQVSIPPFMRIICEVSAIESSVGTAETGRRA